jgi:hypothetical protein
MVAPQRERTIMALRITIDIFSGRPNPVVEVDGKQAREILARIKPAEALRKGAMPAPLSRLGYRGLIIEQTGAATRALPRAFRVAAGAIHGPELAHTISDPEFEEYFLKSKGLAGSVKVVRDFPRLLQKEIKRLKESQAIRAPRGFPWPLKQTCRCAPLYEPAWWNDGGQRQWNNNCYNYATNYRTDTFAQPGQANGAMYTALTCASVRPAAIADALIHTPKANNRCPKEGHLVALVIWPGVDFHWYRKGRNGMWTHKPGSTAATNVDNSGNPIPDPRTADRGGYTDFCTFMTVMHGHTKIT